MAPSLFNMVPAYCTYMQDAYVFINCALLRLQLIAWSYTLCKDNPTLLDCIAAVPNKLRMFVQPDAKIGLKNVLTVSEPNKQNCL